MRFESLRLRHFRNYTDLSLSIPSGVVVFFGANGQGKTNLMEAFHLLLRGESFRPCSRKTLLQSTESETYQLLPQSYPHSHVEAATIEARLTHQNLTHEIKMNLSEAKKTLLWNNKRVTARSLARHFPLVLFSPESLSAIKEGPDLRRQLVDDLLLTHSVASAKILSDFRSALKMRNRLLRDAAQDKMPQSQARQILDSLDPSYLPLATELTCSRLNALEALAEDFKSACRRVLQRPDVDISVDYVVSDRSIRGWDRSEILSALHKRALELRESELSAGVSLVGPHKHDIKILFSGKDSRFFCSQGQQRALILSFKMAQILYHYRAYQAYPFLLLDDVLSELDPIKRSSLVEFLREIPSQIFLTTTDLSFSMDFGDRRLTVFRVEKGTVEVSDGK